MDISVLWEHPEMRDRNRVLLIGTTIEGAYSHVINYTLIKHGMECYMFDHREVIRTSGKRVANKLLQVWVDAIQPDRVLALKGRGLNPEVIEDIPCETVLWWLDGVNRYSDFRSYIDIYDNYYVLEVGQGHPWMSIGIEPDIHRPVSVEDEKWDSDVVFAGTSHVRRTPRIIRIIANMPWDTKIWGNGWPPVPWYQGEPVYWGDLMRAYSGSKLILNNHYEAGITPNMRSIEAPASGTAMVSDTGEGINACLEPGEEYIPYDNLIDAKRQIAKYLEEDEERERIAKAGRERVMEDHLLIYKLKEMLE